MAITVAMRTQVSQLYVALFGRAPDAEGLGFWVGRLDAGQTLTQVANAMYATAPARAYYPSFLTNQEVIASFYVNVLGRTADAEGLAFWTAKLNATGATPGSVITEMVNVVANYTGTAPAGLTSQALFNDKVAVAQYYGEHNGTIAGATAVLGTVTADPATVVAAKAAIDIAANTVTLTAGADNLSGLLFNAPRGFTPGGTDSVNTLNDDDVLTGTGPGATLTFDYVNDADTADYDIMPTLKNISTINVKFATSAAGTASLDLQDADATVDTINISRIDSNLVLASVNNLIDGVSKISVTDSNAPATNVEVTFTQAAVAAAGQSTTVDLANAQVASLRVESDADGVAGGATIADAGIESITLNSIKASNIVGLFSAEDVETITVTGDKNLRIGTRTAVTGAQGVEAQTYADGLANVNGSLTVINASALTGDLDLSLGTEFQANRDGTSGTGIVLAVTGGAGNDTFRLVNSTVAGTDTINGGAGANTVVVTGTATITAGGTGAAPVANVTNVQALEVRGGHDAGFVADAVTIDANAFDKLATIFVRNEGSAAGLSGAEVLTTTLSNLTAAQAAAITIAHGTTGNDGNANNNLVANLKTATGASDTVGVTIVDGVNNDPRFNFNLTTNAVENVTLTDSDTESNSVFLASAATHTGTITLTGGAAGLFLNLDTDGAGAGLQGRDTSGATAGDIVGWQDAVATSTRLVAATINASGEAANVTVRVSTTAANTNGGQSITMGSGNDIVIFDDISAASATRGQAGLTNADTVVGGTGSDTLVLDGDGVNVVIQQSEWDNVSNMETVYLAGNGAGNKYFIQLDNDMIIANGVNGNLVAIDNDDDSTVSTGTNVDSRISNTAVRLDATTLSANVHFSYDGEEGTGATADRFVVNDNNTNGGNIIDGGDVSVAVVGGVQPGGVQSADVLEVRNTATVTTADLSNVRNVGIIVINNDQAVLQTLNLSLNSSTVDALSDAGHTASLTQTEALTITANDGLMTDAAGTALIPVAAARIVMDARAVGGAYSLTVNGDTAFGGANDLVSATVNLGGAAQTYNLSAGAADTVNLYGLDATPGADAVTIATVGAATTLTFSNAGVPGSTQTFNLNGVEVLNLFTSAGAAAAVSPTFTVTAGADTVIGTNLNDTISSLAGDDTINGGAGNDTITGGAGNDTVTAGEGADTVVIGDGQDIVSLTETTAAADTLVWNTVFAAGNANAATVTGFAFGAGLDMIDMQQTLVNGTTSTSALAALAPVAVASNGTATANDVIFTFNGAGDLLAAGTTVANAVANAVTALTSGTDFSSANIVAGDSLILQMNDGTNTFVFHYVADATPGTTAAADLTLIGMFNGTTVQALTGDFI